MCKEKLKLDALFICLTPLQLVIASRIIEEKKLKNYGIMAIYIGKSERYDYYYKKLKNKAIFALKFKPYVSNKGFFYFFNVLRFNLTVIHKIKKNKIKDIYFASIDNRYLQSVLSKINATKNWYSFDDGYANLNYTGIYYSIENNERKKFKALLWKYITGIKISQKEIKKNIAKHYTIYNDKKNIITNVEYISLLNSEKIINVARSGTVKIFVGQPLWEINYTLNEQFILNILKMFSIKKYYPHPRENYTFPSSINIINSNKIIEEYIIDYYNDEKLKCIELYTFCSTAVLNLIGFSFVKVNIIRTPNIPSHIYDVFSMFEDKINFLDCRVKQSLTEK